MKEPIDNVKWMTDFYASIGIFVSFIDGKPVAWSPYYFSYIEDCTFSKPLQATSTEPIA